MTLRFIYTMQTKNTNSNHFPYSGENFVQN